MKRKLDSHRAGFTLVEVLMAFGISALFVGVMAATFLGISSTNATAQSHVQASQVIRGAIEELKAGAFNAIGAAPGYTGNPPVRTTAVAYAAGPDNVFGTADDLTGTLTVTVADMLDMDNDGNTAEGWIDIDTQGPGGVNDQIARPVRVAFTWAQPIAGADKQYSLFADTLVAQ